jgi:peptidoglycan hydrolase CwlO-like protein
VAERATETEADCTQKQVETMGKEKRMLSCQLESCKKEIRILVQEVDKLKDQINEEKELSCSLQRKLEEAADTVKRKTSELYKLKTQDDVGCQVTEKQAIKNEEVEG